MQDLEFLSEVRGVQELEQSEFAVAEARGLGGGFQAACPSAHPSAPPRPVSAHYGFRCCEQLGKIVTIELECDLHINSPRIELITPLQLR